MRVITVLEAYRKHIKSVQHWVSFPSRLTPNKPQAWSSC